MKHFSLHTGDCLAVLKTMPDNSVDSIVTDPPYGIGFMGNKWDYDVPKVEIWAECLRVLKSGGHLLAFAGTRTQHRMAVNIEDAGFEIRDMIAWVYGSGFPKSMDISKAIDKAAGAEREVIGEKLTGRANAPRSEGRNHVDCGGGQMTVNVTAPATDEAREWEGWGTALKPALEPITMARKPIKGTVTANVLAHGVGALNIDACRVATDDKLSAGAGGLLSNVRDDKAYPADNGFEQSPLGRWPANFIHDGSDEVVELFPAKAGAAAPVKGTESSLASTGNVTGKRDRVAGVFHSDSGSAARFFYCPKASKKDRDEGLDEFAEVQGSGLPMRSKDGERGGQGIDGTKTDRLTVRKNTHSTVKPTELMAYLIKLVTPAGGVVLDPFMGSGSTGKAAMREGFQFIGIEIDENYVQIARARIEHEHTK